MRVEFLRIPFFSLSIYFLFTENCVQASRAFFITSRASLIRICRWSCFNTILTFPLLFYASFDVHFPPIRCLIEMFKFIMHFANNQRHLHRNFHLRKFYSPLLVALKLFFVFYFTLATVAQHKT